MFRTGPRLLAFLVVAAVLLSVATVGFAVVRVRRGGSIALDLRERDGSEIALQLPAAVAELALPLIPRPLLREATAELAPWLPAAVAVSSKLEGTPDFVLVEIESATEHVRIAKRGKELVIVLQEGDGSFSLTVPLDTARSFLTRLAAA